MDEPPTRSISSTTANSTVLLLRCGFRLRRSSRNRRKPGYSGSVDDFAVRIEARSVTRTIPRFLRVVPAHDAVQVWANRRALMNGAVIVSIYSDLSSAATDHRAVAGLDRVDGHRFAAGEIILVLFGGVCILLHVLGRSAQSNA